MSGTPFLLHGGYPGNYPRQGGYPQQQYPPKQYQPGYNPQSQYPPSNQYPPPSNQYPPQYSQQQYPPQNPQYPSQYPPQNPQYQNPPPQNPQYQQAQASNWSQQYYNQLSPTDLQNLQAWFSWVDTDRSGSIEAHELAQLQFNGKPIGQSLASKLIKIFDKSQNGTIDFREYCSLHQYLTRMQQQFYLADADRSGRLDAQEIHGALSNNGFRLGLTTVSAICRKYDTTGSGLTFDQFLDCCAHLAIVRSIFEWNDRNRSGTVTLTFDQLAHVTVHLMERQQ